MHRKVPSCHPYAWDADCYTYCMIGSVLIDHHLGDCSVEMTLGMDLTYF
jgi:hypothetical protein